jgi:hypothetical protein
MSAGNHARRPISPMGKSEYFGRKVARPMTEDLTHFTKDDEKAEDRNFAAANIGRTQLSSDKYGEIFSQAALHAMVQAPVTAVAELFSKEAAAGAQFLPAPAQFAEGTTAWHIQQAGRAIGTLVPCAILMKGTAGLIGKEAGLAKQLGAAALAGGLYGGFLTPTGQVEGSLLENRLYSAANTAGSFALVHSLATGAHRFRDYMSAGSPSLGAAFQTRLGAGLLSAPVGLLSAELEAMLHQRTISNAERLSSLYTFGLLGAIASPTRPSRQTLTEQADVINGTAPFPYRLNFGPPEKPFMHENPLADNVFARLKSQEVPAHIARYYIERAPLAETEADFQPGMKEAVEFAKLSPAEQVERLLAQKEASEQSAKRVEAALARQIRRDVAVGPERVTQQTPVEVNTAPSRSAADPNLSSYLLLDIGRALPESPLRHTAINGAKAWLKLDKACYNEFLKQHVENPASSLADYRLDRSRAVSYSERMRDSLFNASHLKLRSTLEPAHRDAVDQAVLRGSCNPHRIFDPTPRPEGLSGWASSDPARPGRIMRIGRNLDNDFRVSHDKVSRIHAELRIDPEGQMHLKDLSTNGQIYINGELHEGKAEIPINPSDKVRIFNTQIDFDLKAADGVKYDFTRYKEPLMLPAEAKPTPTAIQQSNNYAKLHEVREPIVDGFRMAGRRVPFDEQGLPDKLDRAIIVVDLSRDPVLREVIAQAKKDLGHLPQKELAEAITKLSKKLMTPSAVTPETQDSMVGQIRSDNAGEPVLLGEFIRRGMGVCGEQALLMKVLSDHLGLDCTIVRGRMLLAGGHAWTKVHLSDGNFIFDPRMEVNGLNTLDGIGNLWQQSIAGTLFVPFEKR